MPPDFHRSTAPVNAASGVRFRVTALSGGTVQLSNPATLGCPVIAETERWLEQIVQPAAALYFGSRVVAMRSGDYACRTRNSRRGAPLSEHAFGNAVDVMAFTLANGRDVTVRRGWRGEEDERAFLREVFLGACRGFSTVLGPAPTPSMTITSISTSPAMMHAGNTGSAAPISASRRASIRMHRRRRNSAHRSSSARLPGLRLPRRRPRSASCPPNRPCPRA